MSLYHGVDFGHQSNGLVQGDDDLLVVVDVFVGQHAAGAGVLAALGLAVLKPFLTDLVAANVEVPYVLGRTLEPGGLCLVELPVY